MSYKSPALKGVGWMSGVRVAARAVAFLRLAVLARILMPSQFGVFGIATLVLSFLEVLTETGINVFLIQQKDKSNEYLSSAWLVSIIRGILIAALIVVTAPFIANFFNSPESLEVLILIALVPLIRGFINPSIINIQKNIEFHKEFYLRTTLLIVDASVAVIVAFVTKSAESMAYGLIISALLEVILSFVLFKPWPKIELEPLKIKFIFKKGWNVTLTGIFVYLSENADNIFVGKMLGTASLGIYQNAYKISTLTISEINEVVNKVTFPVYSKFSDDTQRLYRAFVRVVLSSSSIALIMGVLIFIFADLIVRIILGPDWMSAVPVVRVLALYGILRTAFGNFSAVFLSVQKQSYVAITTFVRLVALLILLVPLINLYGMVGAGFAMLISMFAEIPIILYFAYAIFRKK